jgi:hypothetical protein
MNSARSGSKRCLRKRSSKRYPPETLEALIRQLKANGPSPKPQ